MSRDLPPDVVRHIAMHVLGLDEDQWGELASLRKQYAEACGDEAESDGAFRARARAIDRVTMVLSVPLPDSVESLNDLRRYTPRAEAAQRKRVGRPTAAARRAQERAARFRAWYEGHKARLGLGSVLKIAKATGLSVPAVQGIEQGAGVPPARVLEVLEECFGDPCPR
jgi:hypothetical protein